MTTIRCSLVGHKWNWRGRHRTDQPYRCERCSRYDDEPGIVRAAKRRATFNRWTPLAVKVSRRQASVRVGLPSHPRIPSLSVRVAFDYGFEKDGCPFGLTVYLDLWRLNLGLSVGGFWLGEESDERALFRLWSDLETSGLRWIGCWLGHKPTESPFTPGYVSCDRCDATLAAPEKAAA
jgi:hypothetical protein